MVGEPSLDLVEPSLDEPKKNWQLGITFTREVDFLTANTCSKYIVSPFPL